MQAIMLPFYKVPAQEPGQAPPDWEQPHLQQLKQEIIYCSIPMFVVPVGTFFAVCNYQPLIDTYGWNKACSVAALAAVFATQMVIGIIVLVKYWEDFMIVMRGEGAKPYDESRKEEAEYF